MPGAFIRDPAVYRWGWAIMKTNYLLDKYVNVATAEVGSTTGYTTTDQLGSQEQETLLIRINPMFIPDKRSYK